MCHTVGLDGKYALSMPAVISRTNTQLLVVKLTDGLQIPLLLLEPSKSAGLLLSAPIPRRQTKKRLKT